MLSPCRGQDLRLGEWSAFTDHRYARSLPRFLTLKADGQRQLLSLRARIREKNGASRRPGSGRMSGSEEMRREAVDRCNESGNAEGTTQCRFSLFCFRRSIPADPEIFRHPTLVGPYVERCERKIRSHWAEAERGVGGYWSIVKFQNDIMARGKRPRAVLSDHDPPPIVLPDPAEDFTLPCSSRGPAKHGRAAQDGEPDRGAETTAS